MPGPPNLQMKHSRAKGYCSGPYPNQQLLSIQLSRRSNIIEDRHSSKTGTREKFWLGAFTVNTRSLIARPPLHFGQHTLSRGPMSIFYPVALLSIETIRRDPLSLYTWILDLETSKSRRPVMLATSRPVKLGSLPQPPTVHYDLPELCKFVELPSAPPTFISLGRYVQILTCSTA